MTLFHQQFLGSLQHSAAQQRMAAAAPRSPIRRRPSANQSDRLRSWANNGRPSDREALDDGVFASRCCCGGLVVDKAPPPNNATAASVARQGVRCPAHLTSPHSNNAIQQDRAQIKKTLTPSPLPHHHHPTPHNRTHSSSNGNEKALAVERGSERTVECVLCHGCVLYLTRGRNSTRKKCLRHRARALVRPSYEERISLLCDEAEKVGDD